MNPYLNIKKLLTESLDAGEAASIAMLLMEKVAGMDRTHVLMGDSVSTETEEKLTDMAYRIMKGEPVQYVIGESEFCGLSFHVGKGVLIPRPETEELVNWITENVSHEDNNRILDIGTGSGCIAISIAKNIPKAYIEAWDISEDAISIAEKNAARNNTEIVFKKKDVLKDINTPEDTFTIIVSNPPYICMSEANDMEINVLDHEPHIALFVPDDDPLLFYRKIAQSGISMLCSTGQLYFEINRQYGKQTAEMLEELGYINIQLRKDQFGNNRMIRAIKP